ncbi:MAG: DUF6703 family protein [Mycobacteriales bacterium]
MPAQRGQQPPFLTPGATPLRHAVERRSAAALFFLRSLPRALPPLLVVGLLAGGVLAPGPIGALCLLAIIVLFGWLLFLSWPALAPQARIIRIAVLAMMAFGVAANLLR